MNRQISIPDSLLERLRKNNSTSKVPERDIDKKVSEQLQGVRQGIDFSQVKFFSNCQQYFTQVITDAKQQQKVLHYKSKIAKLKQINSQQSFTTNQADQMLYLNLIVDYFRSYNLNYSYVTIMREKNLIPEEVVLKGDLVKLLGLSDIYEKQQQFNVSILELLMKNVNKYNQIFANRKVNSKDIGIDCDILTNYNQTNNILLTELKLQQIRQTTQNRQKKYYETQIHLFKSQQLMKVKEDLLKLYESKQSKIRGEYEQKLKELIERNKQPSQMTIKYYVKKQEQDLQAISDLKKQLNLLKDRIKSLQHQILSHDCLSTQTVRSRLDILQTQRNSLISRKKDFQLALRNMQTKVQEVCQQKMKIMVGGQRQTEEYLSKMKIHSQTKEAAVEKLYSTLRMFERRNLTLQTDIDNLRQQNFRLNQQLQNQQPLPNPTVTQQPFYQPSQTIPLYKQNTEKKKQPIHQLKFPRKNAFTQVIPQDIDACFPKQSHSQKRVSFREDQSIQQQENDSEISILSLSSEAFEQNLTLRELQNKKINQIKFDLATLKNKIKLLTMDLQ